MATEILQNRNAVLCLCMQYAIKVAYLVSGLKAQRTQTTPFMVRKRSKNSKVLVYKVNAALFLIVSCALR